jgi:uncharacterized peroxidase-related enzyme
MAWINTTRPEEATGALAREYERAMRRSGTVASVLRVMSPNPDALRASMQLYETLMFGRSPLSRTQRELTATAVSVFNECHYWTAHHGEALRTESGDDELADSAMADPHTAELGAQDQAILQYAEKLTKRPEQVTIQDVQRLREAGLCDRSIHDLAQVVALFAYFNRIAAGLGVELEDGAV